MNLATSLKRPMFKPPMRESLWYPRSNLACFCRDGLADDCDPTQIGDPGQRKDFLPKVQAQLCPHGPLALRAGLTGRDPCFNRDLAISGLCSDPLLKIQLLVG